MGLSSSTPLERRNTVARRSQRRTIHNIKSKVDRIAQEVKKFKGIEEDSNFQILMSEINHLKVELMRKSKDLQPQVRNIHQVTLNKIEECVQTLENKLLENQEKFRKKEEVNEEKARKKEQKNKDKSHENSDMSYDVTVIEENDEAEELAASTEKRKTLEVKFVQIIPPGENEPPENQGRSSRIVSPEEKRKSILKVGVPVMPGAMMNEISSKSKKISSHYNHIDSVVKTEEDILARVNEIVNNLQAIECQIADFVGRKNGTQYNRIRDHLNEYLIELNQVNTADNFINEQIKLCKNYIGSNMNFLDEKVINDERYDSNDDVFQADNNNVPLSPVEVQRKLEKLTRTTAI